MVASVNNILFRVSVIFLISVVVLYIYAYQQSLVYVFESPLSFASPIGGTQQHSLSHTSIHIHPSHRQLTSAITREFFFVGDSLLHIPSSYFKISQTLTTRLVYLHPEYSVRVKLFTDSDYRMHNISMGLQDVFGLRRNKGTSLPDAVFIYCGHDMMLSQQGDKHAQGHYVKALTRLLHFLSDHVKHVAIVTPGLFGPRGEMPTYW
jgi:hypothetical protein